MIRSEIKNPARRLPDGLVNSDERG